MLRPLLLTTALITLCASGCVRRFVASETRYVLAARYVHNQPVEEVWPTALELLREDGYTLRESATSYEAVSDWRIESNDSVISGSYSKYLVFAERLEADRCIIRFVRINGIADGVEEHAMGGHKVFTLRQVKGKYGLNRQVAVGNGSGRGFWSRRDLKLEYRLMARLRPDIALQTDAEIQRHLPDFLKSSRDELEAVKIGNIAARLSSNGKPAPQQVASGVGETRATLTANTQAASALRTEWEPVDPNCGEAIHGEEAITAAGRLVLLGETPGTSEIPRFVGQLACRAAREGGEVKVGVELPHDEQGRIDAYLASQGTAADRVALLKGGFWRRAWQDGRSSEAVLRLIEQVRRLRAEGKAVSLFAFDARGVGGNLRQQALAQRVLAVRRAAPRALMLVLTGNVQARIVSGADWDTRLVPMGARLLEAEPGLLALDAHYSGGHAWTCRLASETRTDCSEGLLPAPQRTRILGRGMGASKEAPEEHRHLTYVRVDRDVAGGAHHGIYYLGRMSASPPALSDPKQHTVVR